MPTFILNLLRAILVEYRKLYSICCVRSIHSSATDKNPQFIVSLTSYGERVYKTAPYAIASLMNQSVFPDRIILWLAHNTPIPPVLQRLSRKGLEIRFCEDIRSYKKLIPALHDFPEDILITTDDDVYYPRNWFEQLKTAYLHDSSMIYTHRAHEIQLDENHAIMSYREWLACIQSPKNTVCIFPTGVGGILYPPHSLDHNPAFDKEFTALAPSADDIWFWAMAKLSGTKHCLIKDGYRQLLYVDPAEELKGLTIVNNQKNQNDVQLKVVIDRFPELIKKI
jgi:hypothetical protein